MTQSVSATSLQPVSELQNSRNALGTKNTKRHEKVPIPFSIVQKGRSFLACLPLAFVPFRVFRGRNALTTACRITAVCWALVAFTVQADDVPPADMILVIGAPGTGAFGEMFHHWADRWIDAAQRGAIRLTVIGSEERRGATDRERCQQSLLAATADEERPLWLVLIGHGTFDKKTARFNLQGPDVTANELAEWLQPLKRPLAVIDCSACSAPFLTTLSADRRIVITATKTGGEENFARFGEFLSQAIDDPAADLDKDDQTSLWEAYLAASRRTAEFYQADGRMQTEHALLDDNGDRQGTRADIFQGLQLQDGVSTSQPTDGAIAHQWHLVPSARDAKLSAEVRQRRDELELQIVKLREQKAKFPADEYYEKLERLLVELARLNQPERGASAP